MIHPCSYAAIELMRKGVTFEELRRLRDHVETLARICGKTDDQVFADDCFVNMAGQEDIADEMAAAVGLKRAKADTSLINLTGNFRALSDYMESAKAEGVNAYIGRASFDRFRVFLLRAAGAIAGTFPKGSFAESVSRKQAAKLVAVTAGRQAARYDNTHMASDVMQMRLMKALLAGKEAEFPAILRQALNEDSKNVAAMLDCIRRRFVMDQPLFCKQPSDQDFMPIARDEITGMLARDSMYGYIAQGLRRHGTEKFLERAAACDGALREMRFSTNRRHSVLSRLAAGEGELDLRLLAYVDKNHPFTYKVDPVNDGLLKQRSLAMKAVRAGMPQTGFAEIRQIVAKSEVLSVAAYAGEDLPLGVWCMLGRGMVADRLYGDRDDAAVFDAADRMKAIQPERAAPVA